MHNLEPDGKIFQHQILKHLWMCALSNSVALPLGIQIPLVFFVLKEIVLVTREGGRLNWKRILLVVFILGAIAGISDLLIGNISDSL